MTEEQNNESNDTNEEELQKGESEEKNKKSQKTKNKKSEIKKAVKDTVRVVHSIVVGNQEALEIGSIIDKSTFSKDEIGRLIKDGHLEEIKV